MKDLGVLKYFQNIEVARNSKVIYLSQRKHALDVIAESGNFGSKLILFPMEIISWQYLLVLFLIMVSNIAG